VFIFELKSKAMKCILLAVTALLLVNLLPAQQKEGKVVYERTMQMNIRVSDNNDALAQMLPQSRTDKFELSFGNNQSIWMHSEDEMENNEFGGNGMQIRMMGPGQNDVIFHDFTTGRRIEQREMLDKKFIIEDSVRKLNWKLSDETQTILGHVCHKATAQRFGQRTQMTMENGKMERKEVSDTTSIVAWFTTDIPVSAGPEVQGQLPGLILGLDMNNGRTVYKALGLSPKAELASIKAPTKGKKVTTEEFRTETSKMMEEMQRNMQGSGNRMIIRN
jgi:GLPGLI family protein